MRAGRPTGTSASTLVRVAASALRSALGGLALLPDLVCGRRVATARPRRRRAGGGAIILSAMRARHAVEVERRRLVGHLGVVDDLEQQVAELALEPVPVLARDRVGDLVGLLDRVGGDRGEGLLDVPRAAALAGRAAAA